MRLRAFAVPFKETTIGGRSRAISFTAISSRNRNMIQLISHRLSTTITLSTDFRETDLEILQGVINNFLSSMAQLQSNPHDSEL